MSYSPYIKIEECARILKLMLYDQNNKLKQTIFIQGTVVCQSELAVVIVNKDRKQYIHVTNNGFTFCDMDNTCYTMKYSLNDRKLIMEYVSRYVVQSACPYTDNCLYSLDDEYIYPKYLDRYVKVKMISGEPIRYDNGIFRNFDFKIKNEIIYKTEQFGWQHFPMIAQYINKKKVFIIIHLFRQLNTPYRDALRYLITNNICDFIQYK